MKYFGRHFAFFKKKKTHFSDVLRHLGHTSARSTG